MIDRFIDFWIDAPSQRWFWALACIGLAASVAAGQWLYVMAIAAGCATLAATRT